MQVVGKVSRMSSSKPSDHPKVNYFTIPTSNGCVLDPSQDDRDGSPSGIVEVFLDNHLRKRHNEDYWKLKQVEVSREQTDQTHGTGMEKYPFQRSLKKKEISPVRVRQLKQKKTYTAEKPFNCDVCGKVFTINGNLTKHKRTHSGEKPFKCDVCGKGFKQNGEPTGHKRTHSGEKPFKCYVCGKGFTENGNLTKHKRTHSGEKPFKCDVCGKGFTHSGDLTKHKRTHSGEKPSICYVCGKCLSLEWSYEDKQLLLHKILQINGIDGTISYRTFQNSINWEAVEVNGRTPEENKMMFHKLITKVRKYRTMKEIVTDAAQLITAGPSKTSKKNLNKKNLIKEYPDFPTTKPQNAYVLFVKKRFKKVQGMKFAERSAFLSLEWKNLPESRKEKYRRKALKLKEKLAEELKVFSVNHPEALLPSISGNNTGRPTLPLPSRLYAESRVEKFSAKHPELNHVEAFKACLKKYEKLFDHRKLKWINKGKDQMQDYEKDVESYRSSHHGSFKPQQFHLTKDEQRIFDDSMGKPPAPAKNLYQYFCESKWSTVADDFSEKSKLLSSLYHKLTQMELDNLETALRQEVQNYAEKYVEFYDSLSENDKQSQLSPIEAMRPYAKILTGAKLSRKPATLGPKDVTVYKQLQLSSFLSTSKKTKKASDESDDEIPPSQVSIKKRKVQVEAMSNSETHLIIE